MEIIHLKEFLAMSEFCNYTAAAETMFVSQPTLYRHIKTLETELGVLLFERHGKKIVLSRFGEQLVPHARRAVEEMEEYSKQLTAELSGSSSTLKIASNYYINDLICNFFEANHKYKVLSIPGESMEDFAALDEYELGVAVSHAPPDDRFDYVTYCEDEIVLTVGAQHPLAQRDSVRLEELRDEDFIGLFSPSDAYITPSFRIAGIYDCFRPKIVMQAQYGSQAAQLAAQGFGVTLLFRRAIEHTGPDEICLLPLDPPARCQVYFYWDKDRKLSDGAKALIEYVKKQRIIH